MNKSHYLKNYFKHNGVVLVCELLIVLLLSIACTLLLGGKPAWLAPVLAIVAYILAELRFMMAYIAKCVKRDRMLEAQARAAAEAEEEELSEEEDEEFVPAEEEEESEEAYADEDEDYEEYAEEDEDIDAFDAEEDEVSEVTDADDEDIDTFEDERTRR